MKEKVIFDTNTIRNTEINTFFGGRPELELFIQDADIIIPFTVVEEIKRQKKAVLKSKRDSFVSNPFHKLRGINEVDTNSFDIDAYIQKLINEETIPFEVIDLKSNDVLPLIKELAITKQPPFEAGDNTDKGFKDALIYFSVLEYLQEVPNKYVFVCAKDNRLGEAFKNNPNVFVVKDYNEFKQHSISQFFDDYFIEKVNEELGITITKENIKEYWYNINDNKVVLIEFEGEEYVIETDSGEIINSIARSEYKVLIDALANSSSFNQTDEVVAELVSLSAFFNNEEILKILNASWKNNQISWIIYKPQIKELIGPLYVARKELLDSLEGVEFLKNVFK
nr:PIN domain-containing protein [uncultured Flavobacterium sp.]